MSSILSAKYLYVRTLLRRSLASSARMRTRMQSAGPYRNKTRSHVMVERARRHVREFWPVDQSRGMWKSPGTDDRRRLRESGEV